MFWFAINTFSGNKNVSFPTCHSPMAIAAFLTTLNAPDFQRDFPVDSFIVTGDIATTGSVEDLAKAKQFFSNGILHDSILPGLDVVSDTAVSKRPIVLLPGNHDRYSRHIRTPSSTSFETVFGTEWNDLPINKAGTTSNARTYGDRVRVFPLARKQGDILAIVAIDCTFRTIGQAKMRKLEWLGQGLVDNRIIEQVALATTRTRQLAVMQGRKCAVLWAIHYCPFSSGALELKSLDRLIKSAADLGVGFWLTGHSHKCYKDELKNSQGNITVLNAGAAFSACRYPNKFSFLHHKVCIHEGGEPKIKTTAFRLDVDEGIFKRVPIQKYS